MCKLRVGMTVRLLVRIVYLTGVSKKQLNSCFLECNEFFTNASQVESVSSVFMSMQNHQVVKAHLSHSRPKVCFHSA